MVNEAGPEMFRPSTDGFIMNAASTERLIRGVESLVTAGGGDTINIYGVSDPMRAARYVGREKRANAWARGVG
jgi:hypothetical protein